MENLGIATELAERRKRFARYAYVAPSMAGKTHRITVNCKTGERTVESDGRPAPVVAQPIIVALPAPPKRTRPLVNPFFRYSKRNDGGVNRPTYADSRGRISSLLYVAAAAFDVTPAEFLAPTRCRRPVYARYAAMHILVKVLRISLPSIGELLHRDHTSIMEGVRAAKRLRRSNDDFAARSRVVARELRRKWSVSP